jgi:hypothetical protein
MKGGHPGSIAYKNASEDCWSHLLCTIFARLHVGIYARSLIVISYEPHTSIGLGKISHRYVKI